MPVVFAEDFETGTTVMAPTVTEGCLVGIVSPGISGQYSARCYVFAQPAFTNAFLYQPLTLANEVHVEFRFRLDSFTPVPGGDLRFLYVGGSVAVAAFLSVHSSGRLLLAYRTEAGVQQLLSTTPIEVGTTYKIKLDMMVGVDGSIAVSLDDVEVADLSVPSIDNSYVGTVESFNVGIIAYNVETTVIVDNLIVADTPLPIQYHTLTVNSTPLGIPFTIQVGFLND